jgi:hypothetical protein
MLGSATRVRLGAAALAVAGVLFILYPTVRPYHDESTEDGAIRSMSSGAWVAAHLFAMIGFILIPLGLLALWYAVGRTRVERLAFLAVVVAWVGSGLTLTYYGGEDFALNAIATKAKKDRSIDLVDLADAVRSHPVGATVFALGLALLGVGAILVSIAIWRSSVLPRYSGIPFAVGMALFIPQFYAPAVVRMIHGAVVAAGLVWIGAVLWREAHRSDRACSAE